MVAILNVTYISPLEMSEKWRSWAARRIFMLAPFGNTFGYKWAKFHALNTKSTFPLYMLELRCLTKY